MGGVELNCPVSQSSMAVLALEAPALDKAVISEYFPPKPACWSRRDASAGLGGSIVMLGGAAGGVKVSDPITFWNVPCNSPFGYAVVLICMNAVLEKIVARSSAMAFDLKVQRIEPSGWTLFAWASVGTSYNPVGCPPPV